MNTKRCRTRVFMYKNFNFLKLPFLKISDLRTRRTLSLLFGLRKCTTIFQRFTFYLVGCDLEILSLYSIAWTVSLRIKTSRGIFHNVVCI